MFFTGISGHLKVCTSIRGWGDNKARSLGEAALLARTMAEDEGLPVGKTLARTGKDGKTAGWYAESILNTVPVYGSRARGAHPERIEANGLRLNADAQSLSAGAEPVWRELQVKREDFARYVDWLRSIW